MGGRKVFVGEEMNFEKKFVSTQENHKNIARNSSSFSVTQNVSPSFNQSKVFPMKISAR